MSEHDLANGIVRLEAISAGFDYNKGRQYVLLAKEFLRGSRERACDTPIFNVCAEIDVDLPEEVSERLEAFIDTRPQYGAATQDICRWYLLELQAMDSGMKPTAPSIYEPLIRMLELGGDFYEHHGALCIRDVAMLPFVNYMS